MKKVYKIISIIILTIFITFGFTVISVGGWDNFKLHSTQFWGLFTITNNPLLTQFDSDFESFDSDNPPRIEPSQLRSGGPPKDGIPSIDNPIFESIDDTPFSDDELIIGVYFNGEARAYPYGILNWHEIVNDKFGDTPVVVTYCPLCDTNPVFIGEVNGEKRTFGVSGKLFQSCLIMFDRETDSLWSQPWGIGVAGEYTNIELQRIPAQRTTLGEWKELHPQTVVLSTQTGHRRDYTRYPYGTYFTDQNLIFPVRNQQLLDTHPKEIVSYIWQFDNNTPLNQFSGESLRVIHSELENQEERTFEFNNMVITAKWDNTLNTVRFFDENGNEMPASSAFSFVYTAYFN